MVPKRVLAGLWLGQLLLCRPLTPPYSLYHPACGHRTTINDWTFDVQSFNTVLPQLSKAHFAHIFYDYTLKFQGGQSDVGVAYGASKHANEFVARYWLNLQ